MTDIILSSIVLFQLHTVPNRYFFMINNQFETIYGIHINTYILSLKTWIYRFNKLVQQSKIYLQIGSQYTFEINKKYINILVFCNRRKDFSLGV